MAPKRVMQADVPECEAGCANRTLRNVKVFKDQICTESLKVATIVNQVVGCSTCGEEFFYPISAKEN